MFIYFFLWKSFLFALYESIFDVKKCRCLQVEIKSHSSCNCECQQGKLSEKLWKLSITVLSSFEQLVVDLTSPHKLLLSYSHHNRATLFVMKQMDKLKQNFSLLSIIITMQMCLWVCSAVRFCVYVMPVMWLTWSAQIDENMWSESLKAKCCSLIHLKIRMPNTKVIQSAIDQRLLIAHANHSRWRQMC